MVNTQKRDEKEIEKRKGKCASMDAQTIVEMAVRDGDRVTQDKFRTNS